MLSKHVTIANFGDDTTLLSNNDDNEETRNNIELLIQIPGHAFRLNTDVEKSY